MGFCFPVSSYAQVAKGKGPAKGAKTQSEKGQVKEDPKESEGDTTLKDQPDSASEGDSEDSDELLKKTKDTEQDKSDVSDNNTEDGEEEKKSPIPVEYGMERRAARVVAEESMKYITDSMARCPLPGCNSKGKAISETLLTHYCIFHPGNNLTGVAVQFAAQDQKNATPVQKCIAIFNIKICYYIVLFIPISSKLDFFCYAKF